MEVSIVMGVPKTWMVDFMENPNQKWMIWIVALFMETPMIVNHLLNAMILQSTNVFPGSQVAPIHDMVDSRPPSKLLKFGGTGEPIADGDMTFTNHDRGSFYWLVVGPPL